MKTKYFFKRLFCVLFIGLVGVSCSENIGGQATSGKVITEEITDVDAYSVVLHGKINIDVLMYDKVQFGFMISESKESLSNHIGREYEVKTLIGQEYKWELEFKEPDSKYYYCAWLKLNGVQYEFGDIKEFKTLALVTPSSGYVDLGLSVKWNAVNVGADAPEAYGDFYSYDEAIGEFGSNLPTKEQFYELIDKCTWKRITYKGVDGYMVTGRKVKGKSIFLPFAGYRDCDGKVKSVDFCGDYLTSSPDVDLDSKVYSCYMTPNGKECYHFERCIGRSVRLVRN